MGRRCFDGFLVHLRVESLADLIAERVPQPINVVHVPKRAGEIIKNYSSIEKARGYLGWEPGVGLADGLDETVQWWLSEAHRK